MATPTPFLTRSFWHTRRSAAAAGIIFAVLLIIGMTMVRLALSDPTPAALQDDADRRRLIHIGLHLVPFAGIAFLWFVGVVRDQMGAIEDRLFSTVLLGSGLLFLAMLFASSATTTSLVTLTTGPDLDGVTWTFGRGTTHALVSVYALRMAAVFTLSVSTLGLRTRALPRWVAYVGYAVALVLLVAAGEHQWVQLLFPLWVLLLSLVIMFTPGPGTPASQATRDLE